MSKTVNIASENNPRVKDWRRIMAGGVRKTGQTLVAGERIVADVVGQVGADARWLVPEDYQGTLPGPAELARCILSRPLFRDLDIFGTGYPMLEVAVAHRLPPFAGPLPQGLHVVVPTQDPTNVGAIIRTAVGLGAAGIHLLPAAAHPFHPRTVRASAGAVFSAPLSALANLGLLRDSGCPLFALESGGEAIALARLPATMALLVGQEGRGLEALGIAGELSQVPRLSLPMVGIESYNAGVASAMAIYEWHRQHSGRGGDQ